MKTVSILSIPFFQGSKKDVLEELFEVLLNGQKSGYIVTPNPEIVVKAQTDTQFQKALQGADLSLADGVGITFAAKVIGIEAIERMPGVELVEAVCKEAVSRSRKGSRNPIRIGFLGGKRNVAEETAECLIEKYPGLYVSFIAEEWGKEGFIGESDDRRLKMEDSDLKMENRMSITPQSSPFKKQSSTISHSSSRIDILFVAFGSPKQEIWMMKNKGKIPAHVMIGVGGAFDMISGRVRRAPKLMRDLGLEWLFRLIVQPWRWRRQLALFTFIYLVLKEKLRNMFN